MQDNSYKNIVFLSKLEVLHALRNRKYSKNNATCTVEKMTVD